MKLFDAHNHLQQLAGPRKLRSAIERAVEAGVAVMAVNGTRPEDWPGVARLASTYPGMIVPCFGVHPWFVEGLNPGWDGELRRRLEEFPSACVGEIGLDRAPGKPGFARQLEIFRFQLRLAAEAGRPAAIHCVRAWQALVEALEGARPARVLLHAYGGAPDLVPVFSRLGAYFSFSGELAQPKRARLRRCLAAAPRARVLFETDSPWDSPAAPGWRGGPAGVAEVAAAAARVLETTAEELAASAWGNARAFLDGLWPGRS